MSTKIKMKRGLKANLPTLDVGEIALCTDTKEVFIGTSTGNQLINGTIDDTEIKNYVESRLSEESTNILTSISNGGMLTASSSEFSGTSNTSMTFETDNHGFSITNDSQSGGQSLSFTINNLSYTVAAGESYTGGFQAFRQVDIVTAVPFRAYTLSYLSI